MAFDGSIVHALLHELKQELQDARIAKIVQPEKDELIVTVKKEGRQKRLLISVNPSLPIMYLTDQNKNAPLQAPSFCMLLRKHLTGGRILLISQPSLERIIEFEIEHFNEMGDLCRKTLTVELMGKYSNIILREGTRILDAIRHVSLLMSSVREVLPGREYFIPFHEEKLDPFTADESSFAEHVYTSGSMNIAKALYTGITGFSPMTAQEILYLAGLDSDRPVSSFTQEERQKIYEGFCFVMERVRSAGTGEEKPGILFKGEGPAEYGAFRYRMYEDPAYFWEIGRAHV